MAEKPRTYDFRITCHLAGGSFETEERVISLELPGFSRPITVVLPDKSKRDDRIIIVRCGGFTSEAEARAAGEPVKTAVMLAGVVIGVGIDVGNDQPAGVGTLLLKGKPDERVQPIVHGLQVLPEVEDMLFAGITWPSASKRIRLDDFQKQVAGAHSLGRPLTKRQTLGSQLYNQSHFQSSAVARFLTLVSAVEALSTASSMSKAAVKLVDNMMRRTAKAARLEASEKKALIERLRLLKKKSIGASCRSLVKMYCGAAEVKDFTRAYKVRSMLLHNGETPKGTDLPAEIRKLDWIVRQLVVNHVIGRSGIV